jgi:type 1 glutamine amidotransferase
MKNAEKMSRRAAIRNVGVLGAGAAIGGKILPLPTAAAPAATTGSSKADVFALIGDRWHSHDYIRTAFTRTLIKEAGAAVTFTSDGALLSRETLAQYKLLIMLCDGLSFPGGYTTPYPFMDPEKVKIVSEPALPALDEKAVNWLTPEQGKAIREFVEKGGSAWFFHNASYISGGNADFRHVEGALFTGHTGFRPYKMKIVNGDHPITRGVKDFVVTEEQHYVIYDKDPKAVLVRSVNEEGLEYKTAAHGNQGATCEACWAYDYGKGRVCFMAPGHTIPSFWNPEYIKLQKNALSWLLHETGE